MTLVTTIIPTIPPRAKLLERAIASVEAQSHNDRELIVILDEEHRGAAWAVQQGIEQSSGDWVTLLGDDDWLLPTHHERLLQVQHEVGADVVYPWYQRVDIEGNFLGEFQRGFGEPFDAARLRNESYITGGGSLIRGDLLRRVGHPGEHRDHYEDHLLYLALLNAGATFYHHPERLYMWMHWQPHNTSGRGENW